MTAEYERLLKCLAAVREKTDFVPEAAVVLGSGLGGFADEIRQVAVVNYADIPGFPVSTAPGHIGRYVFGYVEDTPVVVMQGRIHLYEGYRPQDVVLPIRLMGLMGAKILFLTNAAGGLRRELAGGSLMLISDHIASFVPNPMIGPNIEEIGERFTDVSDLYNARLRSLIRETAEKEGIALHEGVYIQFTGPTYESAAEIRMAGLLGASAVGMSTAVEALAAHHMGMKVCGVSCISNLGTGLSDVPLSTQDVIDAAAATAPRFRRLMWSSLAAMHGVFEA